MWYEGGIVRAGFLHFRRLQLREKSWHACMGGREWHGVPLCVVCDFEYRPLLPQARDQRCCSRGRS